MSVEKHAYCKTHFLKHFFQVSADETCRNCNISFETLMKHLAKKPECRSNYTEEEIQNFKTLRKAAANKRYKRQNKEKTADYNRGYNKNNKAKSSQKKKEYYRKNQETIAAKQKNYKLKNREELVKKHRIYNSKNREELVKKNRIYNVKNREEKVKKQRIYNIKNQEDIKEKQSEYNDMYVNKRPRYPRNWDWSKIAGHMLLSTTPKYKKFNGNETRREVMWMSQEQLVDYMQHYKKKGHSQYQGLSFDYSLMLTSDEIKPENQPKCDQMFSYQQNPLNCEIGLSNTVIFPGDGIFKGEEVTEVINVITKLRTKPDQPEAEDDTVINWWINPEHLLQAVLEWKFRDHLCLRGIRFKFMSDYGNDWESKCTWSENKREENEEKVVKSWKDLSDKPQELLEKYHKRSTSEFQSSSEKQQEDKEATDSEDSSEEQNFLIWVLDEEPNHCYCDEYMCSKCYCKQRAISEAELEEITEHVIGRETDSGDILLRILAADEPKILVLVDEPNSCFCDKYTCTECFCENTGMSKEKLLERTEKLDETENGKILLKLLKKTNLQSINQHIDKQ